MLRMYVLSFLIGLMYPAHFGFAQEVERTVADISVGDSPDSVSVASAVRLSEKYLTASPETRAEVEQALGRYRGPIEPVIQKLAAAQAKEWEHDTGVIKADHFKTPGLREKYKDDLLYFLVPEEYDAAKPLGLLVFMHGGGKGSPRNSAWHVLSTPQEDSQTYDLRPYIEHAPFITVAPSAPWNENTHKRWCVPEADDYIAAVIRECHYRFNIDRDRVFLGGNSMGGFGAYHLCQRLSDRIAGGILSAGAWRVANWRCMIGTPLFMIHGANDAVAPGTSGKKARPRHTDVFYARAAHKLLEDAGAEHVYAEHPGGHAIRNADTSLGRLVPWMKTKRRDPCFPRVVAITPRGWHAQSDLPVPHEHWADAPFNRPTPHNRWVSILEIDSGAIPFDAGKYTGPPPTWGESLEDFDKQRFQLTKAMVNAGLVDARYQGENLFQVKTKNVRRFSLWLHPKMVDFAKPVVVVINGRKRSYEAVPTLLDALQSYQRREDWGLIYHCELVLDVD